MLSKLLQALGIRVSDDDLQKVEQLIPQIPGLVNALIAAVNNLNTRFALMEQNIQILAQAIQELRNARSNGRSDSEQSGNRTFRITDQ